ncbi:MAG: phage resistance protein [Acidobacteriia bacterium]|nr:phage resistance protein [Terriglobia bacterium]
MTKLRDLFDLPERVNPGDFVLKLSDVVDHPDAALKDYVVTDQLARCFDDALSLVESAITSRESKATYLHGSFGAGKSHFMAVLYLLLQGNTAARSLEKLAPVITKHNRWTQGKKFLLVPYHMIGAESVEQRLLGGYYDLVSKLHPDHPPAGLFPSDALMENALALRDQMGDQAFFESLNGGASGEWGALEGNWDTASFAVAARAGGGSSERGQLVDALVRSLFPAARQTAGFVSLDEGLAVISRHAQGLGYDGVILFLDELILWLASRSGDTAFVNREAPKLVKLVEAGAGARPIPIVSFIARQRDLRTLMGEHALGAEVRNFEDALAYFEARFSRITLEDRNLAAIAQHRILRPKNETARLQIKQAFEKVKREPESVRDVLLTSESTIEEFEQLYPFSPALVKTLVVVSSALQRERTALKIMMQLLVDNQDTMELGELMPVGSLFGAMLDGHDAFSAELRHQFDKARKLWEQKLRLALLRSAGLTEEQLLTLPTDNAQVRRFRTDERIIGTLVLSALAPEAETLRALTARRLAALNYGTIKVPIPGGESQLVEQRCRQWAAEVGEIKITGSGVDPVMSLQLSGVDTTAILANAQHEDNTGNRLQKIRQLLFEEMDIAYENTFQIGHKVTWRATPREAELRFANVWEADDSTLRSDGDTWRVVIDFPFDRDHNTPFADLHRLERFRGANPPSKTIVWLPSFFSTGLQTELGRFVVLEFLLSNDERLRQYSTHLSLADRAEAKTILTNQRDQLRERLRRSLRMAYGVMNPEPGILDEALRLEKDQQFQSLDATIAIRPPAAADLRSALDNLIEQGLDGQYPAHPKFSKDELKLNNRLVEEAYATIRGALEAPDSRVQIERELRKKLRPLLDPMELAHVGEQFLAVKTAWFDRFDPREAQLPNRMATVGQLRQWMNEPNRMGLPEILENLVILTYACQASRMLTLQGIQVPESLTNLRDDVVLERQKLPEQKAWEQVCERASHIFGVTIPALPTLANLQKLNDQVSELNKQLGPDVANYVGKLRSMLPILVGDFTDVQRYKTAVLTSTLCQAIQRAKKPSEVFEAIQTAQVTTPSAMGEVFKQAARVHRALDQVRLDVFESLGQVQDEPRAGVAKMLRQEIQDALRAEEHATALDSVVGRWLDDSMKLLLEAPRDITPFTAPRPAVSDISLPPASALPGTTVTEGKRTIKGASAWKSFREEIERELTEDAELEINWRIVKKLQ